MISFVPAYKPAALGALRDLPRTREPELPEADARLAAEALIRYVLGHVAVEQNHAELVRARILEPDPAGGGDAAFTFGVTARLRGLTAPAGDRQVRR